jgi:hypothetical protein
MLSLSISFKFSYQNQNVVPGRLDITQGHKMIVFEVFEYQRIIINIII